MLVQFRPINRGREVIKDRVFNEEGETESDGETFYIF
jgi:hypothetical protein